MTETDTSWAQDEEFDPLSLEIAPQPGPQTILLATTCPEVLYGGALMSGKSYGLGLAFLNHHNNAEAMGKGAHVTGIIFRLSVPELEDLIKKFKEILEPHGWEYKIGKRTFVHPDGAECKMRHLEDEKDMRKYWGHEYTFMGADEIGDFPKKTFEYVQRLRAARLRSAHGIPVQFIGTANPCGQGHKFCKERYIDPAPAFTPHKDARSKHDIIFIPGRMENNIKAVLNDPEYRERCQSMGPSWYVKALIDGDWSISPEGNMFHREWFNNRFNPFHLPVFDFKLVSWDTAFKTTKDSAESAVTVWGITKTHFYLLEAWSAQIEFPPLVLKTQAVYDAWCPGIMYNCVEDKASGPSLIQTLKTQTSMPIKAIKVDGDKQRRAFSVTPFFENGTVLLPQNAPWLDKYIEQLCSFPAPTGFADLVDSTSQAINEIIKIKKRQEKFGVNNNVVNLPVSIYGV